mgnify:CR=1 FL=1
MRSQSSASINLLDPNKSQTHIALKTSHFGIETLFPVQDALLLSLIIIQLLKNVKSVLLEQPTTLQEIHVQNNVAQVNN